MYHIVTVLIQIKCNILIHNHIIAEKIKKKFFIIKFINFFFKVIQMFFRLFNIFPCFFPYEIIIGNRIAKVC